MNRLSPLVARPQARSGRARYPWIDSPPEAAPSLDDLRLFTTAFLGGLVFFGTFLA
jgi:hypothetical protein